ncbi:hypothetical protein HC251_24220 [Iamia sp. SCSIO 61187]|uniref:hypothetical protein n=1 Tax=Iamia sp. SCSIO 61187 TaxID=2722752 RepID=UPI001C626546|nr:hypothetical protein [Iamia sp. SCSIO 61187]QYG95228.1 hypothetical protein HC251_24220 [Iamia sp. SCSIO 61187]
MSAWDDWDDDEPAAADAPNRAWVGVVAILVLVPFVLLWAGAAGAARGAGTGMVAVVVFFAVVAAAFALVRRWLRRKLGGAP